MFICEVIVIIIIIIILICQKLWSVGPVQQKINLPSPYCDCYFPFLMTMFLSTVVPKVVSQSTYGEDHVFFCK